MAKILYLGTADEVTVEKGHDFHGRLADPITTNVVWDWSNNHLVDTDELGLSEDAVALLLEDKERFRDVTDLKRIPASGPAKMWRSAPGEEPSVPLIGAPAASGTPESEALQTGASATSDAGTSEGGSTASSTSTASRGRGSRT